MILTIDTDKESAKRLRQIARFLEELANGPSTPANIFDGGSDGSSGSDAGMGGMAGAFGLFDSDDGDDADDEPPRREPPSASLSEELDVFEVQPY